VDGEDGDADPPLHHVRVRGIRKEEGAFLIPPDDLWMLGFAATVILVLGLLLYAGSRLSGKGGKPAATAPAQDEPQVTAAPEKKRSTDLLDDVVMFGLLLTDYDDYIE
jgi:hypothetical protein